ncbi:hypothetical protein [Aurantibacillus circumpalustris]|uniref:hypothetical protein n=1 Tax=Aurantibacillus circumpalustris TaxID=3036359 RepID=UPI00295B0944|nr:hypothetical protein [Aurantibacillus circumpalustris]
MKKHIIAFGLLCGFYSCSEDLCKEHKSEKYYGSYSKKYSNISIENGPRQGFQYYDTAGTAFNYRYITTTITNDSVVPIRLKISFSKEYNSLRSTNSLKAKILLLPRELTPDRQHFDNSMSVELKTFLDKDVDKPVSLDKIINPNERLVMTFGVLTNVIDGEFMRMELITSNSKFHLNRHDSITSVSNKSENSSTMYLALELVNSYIIPCGEISFPE